MLVECKNCGAPLSVQRDDARYVECGYCAKTNRVGKLKTLQAQTPVQWRPPEVWVRAGGAGSLEYTETRVKAVSAGLMVAIIGTVFAAIAGVVATLVVIGGASVAITETASHPGQLEAFTWDGTTPYACGGHDRPTISNVTATLPDLVAISVSGHCELTIEGSSISARLPLAVSQHGRVVMRGGRLEGSPNAIEARGHASVEATGVALIGEVTTERHANVTR